VGVKAELLPEDSADIGRRVTDFIGEFWIMGAHAYEFQLSHPDVLCGLALTVKCLAFYV